MKTVVFRFFVFMFSVILLAACGNPVELIFTDISKLTLSYSDFSGSLDADEVKKIPPTGKLVGLAVGRDVEYSIQSIPYTNGIKINDFGVVEVKRNALENPVGTKYSVTVTATGKGIYLGTQKAKFTIKVLERSLPTLEGSVIYEPITTNFGVGKTGLIPDTRALTGSDGRVLQSLRYTALDDTDELAPGIKINEKTGAVTVADTVEVREETHYSVKVSAEGYLSRILNSVVSVTVTVYNSENQNKITGVLEYLPIYTNYSKSYIQEPTIKSLKVSNNGKSYTLTNAYYSMFDRAGQLAHGITIDGNTGVVTVTNQAEVMSKKYYNVRVTDIYDSDITRVFLNAVSVTVYPKNFESINVFKNTNSGPTKTVQAFTANSDSIHEYLSDDYTVGTHYTLNITPQDPDQNINGAISITPQTGHIQIKSSVSVADAGVYIITATGKGNYTNDESSTKLKWTLKVFDAVSGLSPSSTTDTTPALSWNAVPGAAGYELQIAGTRAGVETAPATSVTGTSYTPTSALTKGKTHYWRVRAKDGDGQSGAWSGVQSLRVDFDAVSGLSPADGATTTDTTPTFSWNSVEGAKGYELQIAGTWAGVETAPATSVKGTSYTPTSALTNEKTHYWRVRAKDGAWSGVQSLMIDLGTMNGLVPTDGSSTTDTMPTFSWNAVEGAKGYELQIAGTWAGVETAPATSVKGTSYTPTSALTNEKTHYWRVRAKDGDGQSGAWSAINSLSVNWGTVSGLSSSSTTDTTDTTPDLSWNAVSGATGYELQIAGSLAGVETAPATSVTGTSYTPTSALTKGKTHYWRVRAKDGDGQSGAWSGVQSLRVDFDAVSGLSPADGATTTDTTPTFSWNSVEGAKGYELQIAGTWAGVETSPATSVKGTSYTPTSALTNEQTHYWRVRAKDGAWSGVQSLMIDLGTMNGLVPTDGSSTTDTMHTFSWNSVEGAAGYEVQIAGSRAGVENAVPVEASAASYTPTTALTNLQTHYWRVRAKDGDGQSGAWSAINSLSVNWGTVSGLSSSSTTDTTPALSWNAVPGAAGYELQIAGTRAGVETAPATSVAGTSYTPTSALTKGKTHYWQVRAKDGAGQYGAWSEVQSLWVDFGAVSGLSPADEATTTDTTPTFSWNAVSGAKGYELQIADSEAGVETSPATSVKGTSYTPTSALTNEQTHYWRVRAKDGAWSGVQSLMIDLGTMNGLVPTDGSSTTDTMHTFSWNSVEGAAGYEVQIAGSRAGVENAVPVEASAASYTPTTALTNLQTHYWRVRAKDGDGQHGAWSTINSLSVNWGTVSGLSPSSTTDTTPDLSWNAVEGAAGYEVQIADSEAGVANAQEVEASAASYTPTTALTNLQTHYWRVRAKDGDGQHGAWSTINSLSVNWGAVSGLSPSSTTDTTPALSWNAVPGAAGYELQIADSEAGVENAVPVEASAASYTPTTALTNLQTHYWRVRAKDGDGQHGAWSTINSLSVNWGAVSGLSSSSTTDTTPTLSWNSVPGAAGYELQITENLAGVKNAPATSVTGTSYTPTSALTKGKTHYWRVRAKDVAGQYGDWSKVHNLWVDFGAVSGLIPADGSSTPDTTPALSWNTVSGATGYELQIAESLTGVENAVPVEASVASYTPRTALTNNTTHHWRVRAVDVYGQSGAWSTINSLSVNWGKVSGLSPSSTTDTTPDLSWNSVEGAAGYEVQIADSEGGLASAQSVEASAASYTPTTALTNLQTHYWRVRAKDGDGQSGAWSTINSLSVNWGTVSGLSPADGSSTPDTTPALSWNAVSGATGYEVQIAGSEGGLDSAQAVEASAASYTPTSALTKGKTHYWRVRAKDGDRQSGDWSAVASIQIGYSVGDSGPAGGIVFYDKGNYSDGWRYLEAARSDHDTSVEWGGHGTFVGGTSTGIGSGKANTEKIVKVLGDGNYTELDGNEVELNGNYAAKICDELVLGGHDDWFLPSKDELNALYEQRDTVEGFSSFVYWSSFEDSSYYAWTQYLSSGSQYYYDKNFDYHVRAVRAF